MHAASSGTPTLSAQEIESFVENGFVRIEEAFPKPLARDARSILWRAMALDPSDPAGWTRPVVWLG